MRTYTQASNQEANEPTTSTQHHEPVEHRSHKHVHVRVPWQQLRVELFVHFTLWLSVRPSVCHCLSVCLSVRPSVHPSIRLSRPLSVCLPLLHTCDMWLTRFE